MPKHDNNNQCTNQPLTAQAIGEKPEPKERKKRKNAKANGKAKGKHPGTMAGRSADHGIIKKL